MATITSASPSSGTTCCVRISRYTIDPILPSFDVLVVVVFPPHFSAHASPIPGFAADLWTRVRDDDPLIEKVKKKKKAANAPEKAEAVDKFKSKTAAENPCAPI